MSDSVSFRNLMQEAIAGDEAAANKIVAEHTDALVRVARQRIGNKLGQRIDAEDVLQSVYRSFFGRLHEGQYEIQTGRDLWNLLVRMTLNKVCRKAKFHGAQKRNIGQERATAADSHALSLSELAETDEPDPQEAAILIEEVQLLLAGLGESESPIIELRLQGYTTPEIAQQTGRAERSIRRVLEHLKQKLTQAVEKDD